MKKDQRIEILVDENAELREENRKLRMSLEEKDENCYSLAKENEKLKKENKKLREMLKGLEFEEGLYD